MCIRMKSISSKSVEWILWRKKSYVCCMFTRIVNICGKLRVHILNVRAEFKVVDKYIDLYVFISVTTCNVMM